MAKYVIADIHGCYDEFMKMLEKINFTGKDELYIIGDIGDRGPEPIKVWNYVIGHKNIHAILGNHDKMFCDAIKEYNIGLWLHNGGGTTYTQVIERGIDFMYGLCKYIELLPKYLVVDNFILCHAGLFVPEDISEVPTVESLVKLNSEGILWGRSHIGKERSYKDFTIICGHTPVQYITKCLDKPKIIKRPGIIYIDCGCCFKDQDGRLACLRLNNMQEFYI